MRVPDAPRSNELLQPEQVKGFKSELIFSNAISRWHLFLETPFSGIARLS